MKRLEIRPPIPPKAPITDQSDAQKAHVMPIRRPTRPRPYVSSMKGPKIEFKTDHLVQASCGRQMGRMWA